MYVDHTVINRQNETDQGILQITWDIPIFLYDKNRAFRVR